MITLAQIIPNILNVKGSHFIDIGNHSASIKFEWLGKVNIDVPQKSVPNPINKSFAKYPTNKLPKPKTIKGKLIKNDDSCTEL